MGIGLAGFILFAAAGDIGGFFFFCHVEMMTVAAVVLDNCVPYGYGAVRARCCAVARCYLLDVLEPVLAWIEDGH